MKAQAIKEVPLFLIEDHWAHIKDVVDFCRPQMNFLWPELAKLPQGSRIVLEASTEILPPSKVYQQKIKLWRSPEDFVVWEAFDGYDDYFSCSTTDKFVLEMFPETPIHRTKEDTSALTIYVAIKLPTGRYAAAMQTIV